FLRNASFWRRSWRHRVARYALSISFWYILILVIFLSLENHLLYRPSPASSWNTPPAALRAEDVTFTSADGTRIHGWWCPTADWNPALGTMLYCHGNMGNLSHRVKAIAEWQNQIQQAVLIIDYPGYGRSDGSPSEAGCYAAADASYDWLLNKQK